MDYYPSHIQVECKTCSKILQKPQPEMTFVYRVKFCPFCGNCTIKAGISDLDFTGKVIAIVSMCIVICTILYMVLSTLANL